MKRRICIILTSVMIMLAQSTFAFTDIPEESALLYKAAEKLASQGIIKGDGDGTFRPYDSITRAEIAQILANFLPDKPADARCGFSDLDASHWAYNAISVMNEMGVVKGDDTGTFRPDDVVLNSEAVTMIIRMSGLEDKALLSGGFPIGYINTAIETTLLNGLSLEIEKPATRGDVAVMVYNMIGIGVN